METGDHLSNGVSLKDHTSRGNQFMSGTMKRHLFFAVIAAFIVTLTSCDKSNDDNKNGGNINISDKKNIFVTIDGKNYKLWDKHKVQDLLNAGFTVDSKLDINKEYDATELDGYYSQSFHIYKGGSIYFDIVPDLWWNKAVLKNHVICGFYLYPTGDNQSFMGRLNGLSTREDVIKALGDPSIQDETMLMYDFFGKSDFSVTFDLRVADKTIRNIRLYCNL